VVNSNVSTENKSIDAATARNILKSVPYEKGFHFFSTDGHYTGETATSLDVFSRDLERADVQSIRYHFGRGDFQKWLKTTIGDQELAANIDKLDRNTSDEIMLNQLTTLLHKRLSELRSIIELP
jgi:hypothetical protein